MNAYQLQLSTMTFDEITSEMHEIERENLKYQKHLFLLGNDLKAEGKKKSDSEVYTFFEAYIEKILSRWQWAKSERDKRKKELFEAAMLEAKSEAENMVFKNRFFVTRDYETSNLVFAIATNNPDPEIWAATMQDPTEFKETTNTTQLYIQAGVRYFGYL